MKMKAKKINVAVHKLVGNEVKTIRTLNNYDFDPSGSFPGSYFQAVYKLMNKLFRISSLKREYSYVVVLDDECAPVSVLVSDPGESSTVGIDLNAITLYAGLVSGRLIAAHNHPGEDSSPSLEDLEAFIWLYDNLGDRFLDAIILSSDPTPSNPTNCYSFFEQGHIRCLDGEEINIYIHHLHKANVRLSREIDKLHSSYTKRFDALENRITALSQEVEKLKKL